HRAPAALRPAGCLVAGAAQRVAQLPGGLLQPVGQTGGVVPGPARDRGGEPLGLLRQGAHLGAGTGGAAGVHVVAPVHAATSLNRTLSSPSSTLAPTTVSRRSACGSVTTRR